MAKVRLETWLEMVEGTNEMGRVLTYGDERIGHYFPEMGYVAIKAEYANAFPEAIRVIALEFGSTKATQALHNVHIVP